MKTTKKEDFDYQQYMREHPPDAAHIQRGTGARKQRFEAARIKRENAFYSPVAFTINERRNILSYVRIIESQWDAD